MSYEDYFAGDQASIKCPYAVFNPLREKDPIVFSESLGFWVVTSFDLVQQILRAPNRFSSTMMLGPRGDEVWQEARRLASESGADGARRRDYASTSNRVLLFADPPAHTVHRSLLSAAFLPSRVRRWEPQIAEIAAEMVDRCIALGEIDFVGTFAYPYASLVVASVLGLPSSDIPLMTKWSQHLNAATGGPEVTKEQIRNAAESRLEFDDYFDDQIEQRLANPTDDLMTEIVQAYTDLDPPISREELYIVLQLVLTGGNDTSAMHMSTMLRHVARHPEQWQRLREDPSRVAPFIEEMLRAHSPSQGGFRLVTEDVELGGKALHAGDMVFYSAGAANRDPDVFPDPDTLHFDRENVKKHLAFGWGVHLCVGAPLARLEMRIALETFAAKVETLNLPPGAEDPPYRNSFILHGPAELRLTLTGDRSATTPASL